MSDDKTKSPARAGYDAYCASTSDPAPYNERVWTEIAKAVASALPTDPRPSPTGEPPPPPPP
jgi:hypothetical protein